MRNEDSDSAGVTATGHPGPSGLGGTGLAEAGLSDAKRRILLSLKRQGATEAATLARAMGSTVVAIRQHLQALEADALVQRARREPRGRGRPASLWSLAPEAESLFPDRHGELNLSLLEAVREVYGEPGLERLVEVRLSQQITAYGELLPGPESPLEERVRALAELRSAEGYMAEARSEGAGSMLLIEHHCPICEAARSCQGFCRSELELFQRSLGPGVHVERIRHLLAEGGRCVYRIEEHRAAESPAEEDRV